MIFLQLFYTFFIIGLFGFGGGYGMLSLIQTETVIRHHWLSSAEFTNIVAISQMTPGPIAQCRLYRRNGSVRQCYSHSCIGAAFAHSDASHQQDVPEIYEDALGSICLYGASSCGGWSAGCCNLVALQCRKLLVAQYKLMAILHKSCLIYCHLCWHDVAEDKPYPHDLLCSSCRTAAALLACSAYKTNILVFPVPAHTRSE